MAKAKTVNRLYAASLLGVSTRYVDILRTKGVLRWEYEGLRVRINADDLAKLMEKRNSERISALLDKRVVA